VCVCALSVMSALEVAAAMSKLVMSVISKHAAPSPLAFALSQCVSCKFLQGVAGWHSVLQRVGGSCSVLQCVAVCSVVQCGAVWCRVVPCGAVC